MKFYALLSARFEVTVVHLLIGRDRKIFKPNFQQFLLSICKNTRKTSPIGLLLIMSHYIWLSLNDFKNFFRFNSDFEMRKFVNQEMQKEPSSSMSNYIEDRINDSQGTRLDRILKMMSAKNDFSNFWNQNWLLKLLTRVNVVINW